MARVAVAPPRHRFILDFDGVIVDSVEEAGLTAHNSLFDVLITSLDDLPPGYLTTFKDNRSIVGPAAEFIPFAEWCHEQASALPRKVAPLSRSELQSRVKANALSHQDRTERFFRKRIELMSTIEKAWPRLHRPYQPLVAVLQKRKPGDFLVLTYKNKKAVELLCRHFAIPVESDHIFAGDAGVTKAANFAALKMRFPADTFTFIDDNVQNLIELKGHSTELELLHAAWGYCTPADCALARAEGIASLDCPDFSARLG